jgi:hypothetical protein
MLRHSTASIVDIQCSKCDTGPGSEKRTWYVHIGKELFAWLHPSHFDVFRCAVVVHFYCICVKMNINSSINSSPSIQFILSKCQWLSPSISIHELCSSVPCYLNSAIYSTTTFVHALSMWFIWRHSPSWSPFWKWKWSKNMWKTAVGNRGTRCHWQSRCSYS